MLLKLRLGYQLLLCFTAFTCFSFPYRLGHCDSYDTLTLNLHLELKSILKKQIVKVPAIWSRISP